MKSLNETVLLNSLAGEFAIWDSESLMFIDSKEKFLNTFGSDTTAIALIKKYPIIVFWLADEGPYNINIRLNSPLTEEETGLIVIKYENLELPISSDIIIGAVEVVGTPIKKEETRKFFYQIKNPEAGLYKVDLYYLYDAEFMEKYEQDKTVDTNEDRTKWVVSIEKVGSNEGLTHAEQIYPME